MLAQSAGAANIYEKAALVRRYSHKSRICLASQGIKQAIWALPAGKLGLSSRKYLFVVIAA
jgi:hypothetical protein